MKFRCMATALLGFWCALGWPAAPKSADPDPYEPLKLYEGGWQVKMIASEKEPDHVVNHCARTGTFFSCEQVLNGKTAGLMIFLPIGRSSSGGQAYRTLVASPDASKPDDWGHLVIDGDTWTYMWTQKDGDKSVAMRNVNHFKDKDHIHFEVQKMADGVNWKTQLAGDEERVKIG